MGPAAYALWNRSPSPDPDDVDALGESDGEADAPGEEDDEDAPLFPLEGKFHDTKDREYVLGLTEIEREEILADRAQQVTQRLQDLQLKKALASSSAAASSGWASVRVLSLFVGRACKCTRAKRRLGACVGARVCGSGCGCGCVLRLVARALGGEMRASGRSLESLVTADP